MNASTARGTAGILALTLLGSALMVAYALRLPLGPDEMGNLHHIERVVTEVPYRDYVPYKTVLGHALEAPALLVSSDPWSSLIAIKLEIVAWIFVSATALGFWLRARYGAPAALLGTFALFTHSTFLERGGELRVDLLATIWGTASILALSSGRAWLAGVLSGLALLMTQKGVYFPIACAVTLMVLTLAARSRAARWSLVRDGGRFAVGAGSTFGAYVLAAVALGGVDPVVESLFSNPKAIAFKTLYEGLRGYWILSWLHNPVAWTVGVSGALWLVARGVSGRRTSMEASADSSPDFSVGVAAVTLFLLCLWHKQPWPYFIVFAIPLAVVSLAATIHAQGRTKLGMALVFLVVVGGLATLARRVPAALARSSEPQALALRGLAAVTPPGATYLAGVAALRGRRHVPGLEWLDTARLGHYRTRPELTLELLRAHPPRAILDNFRIEGLADEVRLYLDERYLPIGGNVRVYAPPLSEDDAEVDLLDGGTFKVIGPDGARVVLADGRSLGVGTTLNLPPGRIRCFAEGGARLAMWSTAPEFEALLGRPNVDLFPSIYNY